MNLKQVVILVGGRGTRLKNLTKKIPKPLIKISGKPFLDYLIDFYSANNINKIVLLTKYKHTIFHKKYHNKKIKNVKIRCVKENSFLGTSGALKNVINILDKKFLYCNGDTFFNINLSKFKRKLKNNLIGILACSENQKNESRYSTYYYNKKKVVSSGIYLFNRDKISNYLVKKGSLENEVLKKLPKNKFKLITFKNKFIDIGTFQDLKKSNKFLNRNVKKKCVFLDRDGVINYDYGYVSRKQNFKFKKNVFKAINFLNKNNFYVIVVSNQSGVGRGYYTEKDVDLLHEWINLRLKRIGAHIDKFYYAPYYSLSKKKKYRLAKKDRKPNIGMFKKAFKEFNIEKKGSFYIGDKNSDKIAAKNIKLEYINVDNNSDLYYLIKNQTSKNL